ncbi:oxidoreductase [Fusarium bulbicola]|nr:oxidoreductase [Fusarium bulbicola]
MSSFWRTKPGNLDNYRSTGELPTSVDIVIIGAGYSAAAILTHILATASSENRPSILVLEARQLCSGATGRNGGHLKPDSYNAISAYASEYGIEAAAEVASFEAANVKAVTDYIQQNKVDCDFVLTRAVDVQLSTGHQRRIKEGYDKLIAAGLETTKDTLSVEEKDAEMVSTLYLFLLDTDAMSSDVWGEVRAQKVVFATNAYTGSLLPEYKDRIIPYRAVCSRIKTPGPYPLLKNTYALRFSDWNFDYLIPRLDGSIIVGGARDAYIRSVDSWYGNVDDTQVITEARSYFDGYMQRHFHGWADSGAYVDDIWTGIMGYSSDRLPRVGPIPGRPGMFIMGGFTGHGMPQIYLCGQAMAKFLLKDTSFKETGLPRLFEETQARLEDPRDRVLEFWGTVTCSYVCCIITTISDHWLTSNKKPKCRPQLPGHNVPSHEQTFRSPDLSVFWVYASNKERMRQSYTTIMQQLKVPCGENNSDVLDLVKQWLEAEHHKPWLMVVDNVDELDLFCGTGGLSRYLPACAQGKLLITTRNRQVAIRATRGRGFIEVPRMNDSEAQDLLSAHLACLEREVADLSILALNLEYLPLILVQAAAFIQENGISVKEYLALLKNDENMVKLLNEDFETSGRDQDSLRAVAKTWAISFRQIQRQSKLAGDLLAFISMFNHQHIPESFCRVSTNPLEQGTH